MKPLLSKEALNQVLLAEQEKWLAYDYEDLRTLLDAPGASWLHDYQITYGGVNVFVELRLLEAENDYLHPALTVGDGTYVVVKRFLIFSKIISNRVTTDWIVYSWGGVDA